MSNQPIQRCPVIHIQNPFEGIGSIYFAEEIVAKFDDGTVLQKPVPSGPGQINLVATMKNPQQEFPVIDDNGQETGETATYEDVYRMLNSVYVFLKKNRATIIAAQEAIRQASGQAD